MEEHSSDDERIGDGLGPHDDGTDEERWVVCAYCDSELELTDDELAQGWYICTECGELTHQINKAGQDSEPGLEFPTHEGTADWVPLTEVTGPEAASLVVSYLRANGVEAHAWQQGAGRAFGLTVGSLGVSHIMVREDQVELAQSILEAEVEDSLERDQKDDDSLSDASRAAMGLAALALSPLGAGLAYGLSRVMGGHDRDEEANVVECPHCGATLELFDQEVAQGHFICPECQRLVQMDHYVICPACQTELALDEVDRRQGWYRCPECDQVTKL